MEVSKETLEKYHLMSFEQFQETKLDYEQDVEYWLMILQGTDHIPNKLIERFIEDLADATLTNLLSVLFDFISAIKIEYKEILQYRKYAREQINLLRESDQ